MVQTENDSKVDVSEKYVEQPNRLPENVVENLKNLKTNIGNLTNDVDNLSESLKKKSWLQRHIESKQVQKVASIQESNANKNGSSNFLVFL